jgi:hypothetical protein
MISVTERERKKHPLTNNEPNPDFHGSWYTCHSPDFHPTFIFMLP